jgi:VanZ family protein
MPAYRTQYLLLAMLLLLLEVIIGAHVHDRFIRPYAGDFLITIFLYCLVQSAVRRPVAPVLAAVLFFSYVIEISQHFHLVTRLGLAHSHLARLVLGSAFSWVDVLAYTLGALLVLAVEYRRAAGRLRVGQG